MGKKGWFSSVKKALSPNSKGKKVEKANKANNKWFDEGKPSVSHSPNLESIEVSHSHPPLEDVNLTDVENEQTENAYSVAEVVQKSTETRFAGKSKEEIAAIKIQTAFRGYLARRALRALRGLVRLKSLVDGPTVKRQSASTLKCMQTLSHVHSQIQTRRLTMLEQNRALQRQLLQKRAKEIESLRMGEEWDDSLQSKEQIEASLLHKYEAAMRRERALAYSYTHQQTWKKAAKSTNLLFMDPTNPHWGWSWLERWMAAGPHDGQSTAGKDDRLSVSNGEITKSFARHHLNSDNLVIPPSPARRSKPGTPKRGPFTQDDDSRSVFSIRSERNNRRHSVGSTVTVRDDESSVPSYMTPTRSAKAKSKLSSPSGEENGEKNEKGSKKRLYFPPSLARARRHSGPPKVETSSIVG